jgi:hypothetical protein
MAARFLLTVFPAVLMVISLGFSLFLKFSPRKPEEPVTPELLEE